jgi:hypothetical protein
MQQVGRDRGATIPAVDDAADRATLLLDNHSPRVIQVKATEVLMSHEVGIWIDHKRAVIVSASEGLVTTQTLESEVEPHPHYSSQLDSGGEKKYEERRGQHLDQYYDEVISQLGQPEALLIFGPGEAKLELKERLSRSKMLSERTVDLETTGKLTNPQIVAKVKEHFRIDR